MNIASARQPWLIGTLLLLAMSCSSFSATPIKAFSLREANRRILSGATMTDDMRKIAEINRFAGMVFDREGGDIILIGKHVDNCPAVTLDDLAVAMRSVLKRKEYPLVSIDPDEATSTNLMQTVRFGGGIQGTRVGRDFLESDIILKRFSLGLLPQVQGLTTYRTLYEQSINHKLIADGRKLTSVVWHTDPKAEELIQNYAGQRGKESGTVQSRFWYYNVDEKCFVTEADDVYLIHELVLGVKALVYPAVTDAPNDPARELGKDALSEHFAATFSERFPEAEIAFPVLKRLKSTFDLLAISTGLAHLGNDCPKMEGLLNRHYVSSVSTPTNYPLHRMLGEFRASKPDSTQLVLLSGGVSLRPLLLDIQSGAYASLVKLVRLSRTNENSLSWELPLAQWQMPNDSLAQSSATNLHPPETDRKVGFSLTLQGFTFDNQQGTAFLGFPGPPSIPRSVPPAFDIQNVKGVSMMMKSDKSTMRPAPNNKLRSLKDDALGAKPAKDSLSWPVPLNKLRNDSRKTKD